MHRSIKKSDLVLKSLANAAGVLVYTSAVAWLFSNGEELFGKVSSFVAPLFMLLLLVISASITGLLVLGKPIHLYLSGLKKEAFTFLFATLAWLVVFAGVLVGVLLMK